MGSNDRPARPATIATTANEGIARAQEIPPRRPVGTVPAGGSPAGTAAGTVVPESTLARQRSQIDDEVVGVLVAVGRILGDCLADDAFELGRQRAIDLRDRRGLLVLNERQSFGDAATGERPLAADHLVQQRPEGEQVGPVVDVRHTRRLLGCHVAGGSHHLAGHGAEQGRGHRCCPVACRRHLGGLGEAEIEDLGVAVFGDEHVGGFQIAMNDAGLVRRTQRLGDLRGEGQCLVDR